MIKILYLDGLIKFTQGHTKKWINMIIKYLDMPEVDFFDDILSFAYFTSKLSF